MNDPAGLDAPPASVDEAIQQGRAHGELARQMALSPEIFEESLKAIVRGWQSAACDASWIAAGQEAARLAYRGRTA